MNDTQLTLTLLPTIPACLFFVLYICERARRVDLRRRLDCIISVDDAAMASRDATIKQLQNDLREARSIKSSAPARDRHPATTHAGSGNYERPNHTFIHPDTPEARTVMASDFKPRTNP